MRARIYVHLVRVFVLCHVCSTLFQVQISDTICKSDLLYCIHAVMVMVMGMVLMVVVVGHAGVRLIVSFFLIIDPALYKIDIIIIKECSLTIYTNIAKELVFY